MLRAERPPAWPRKPSPGAAVADREAQAHARSCGPNSSGNPRSVAHCSISLNCNLPTWKTMRRTPRPRRSWRQPRRSQCHRSSEAGCVSIEQLYARYRIYDAPTIRSLLSKELPKDASIEEQWLTKYSRPTKVKLVGVWDTVGALGLPLGSAAAPPLHWRYVSAQLMIEAYPLNCHYYNGTQKLGSQKSTRTCGTVVWCFARQRPIFPPALSRSTSVRGRIAC
jgi:hypothetical protein